MGEVLELSHSSTESKAMRSITPESLIVLTTNQCTATCNHCCMNSSAKRRERVDHALMLKTISEFKRLYNIKVVVFAGGEPTLLKASLLGALSLCRQLRVMSRLVTNVSWATTEAKATEGFRALYEAGLNEVNISCDDYHDPFIPFERVKYAWKAARKFPFRAIIIANASHKGSRLTPEYIQAELGEALPMRFDTDGHELSGTVADPTTGTLLGMSNSALQRLGRAKGTFDAEDVDARYSEYVLNQPCPNAVKSPALTPEGTLAACCGFELSGNPVLDFGSLRSKEVTQAIKDANDNMIVSIISRLGPGFLVKFANKMSPGIIPTQDYVGICEACQDVVQNEKVLKVLFENRVRLAALVRNLDAFETADLVGAG